MTPLEYLATPADFYFELSQAKAAWNEGKKEGRVMNTKPH